MDFIEKVFSILNAVAYFIGYSVIGLVLYSAATGNIHHIEDGKSNIIIRW